MRPCPREFWLSWWKAVQLRYRSNENPDCPCCGEKTLRFQWYEIDKRYRYYYCVECDKAGRTPFLRARFNGVWMD